MLELPNLFEIQLELNDNFILTYGNSNSQNIILLSKLRLIILQKFREALFSWEIEPSTNVHVSIF